jgi:hypothetical protein
LWVLFRRVMQPTEVNRPQGGDQRRAGDRETSAAIIFVAASGRRWRQLPPVFGPAWPTVYRRFAQWSRDRGLSAYERSSSDKGVGRAPMPPVGNPELALVLAGVPDSLAQTGGDLYAVINRCRGRRQPGQAGARRTARCGRCCC